MFDLMIIDDDENVRENLKTAIDWKKLDVQLVCEAEDGETARELYQAYRPKIIITDINIPVISGLDLIEELKQEDPELLFIVITGYTDFELAQRSLNLSAFKLLSKPIFPDTINESILDAVKFLEEARGRKKRMDEMQELMAASLPQMRETFMLKLLRNPPKDSTLIATRLRQLKISFPEPIYMVAVVTTHVSAQDLDEKDVILLYLKKTLSQMLSEVGLYAFSLVDSDSQINCIINMPQGCTVSRIESVFVRLGEQMRYVHEARSFAGIGMQVQQLSQIHQSWQAAVSSLKYKSLLGSEDIVFYDNLKQIDELHLQTPVSSYLQNRFREGDLEAISVTLHSHMEGILQNPAADPNAGRVFLLEYITSISSEAMLLGLNLEQLGSYQELIVRLFQNRDVQNYVQDVLNLTEYLLNEIERKRDSNSNYLIGMAKEYIRDNLSDKELDLDKVCNHVGLSRFYFSKLFHQTEQMGFSAYLKAERIQMAKKLLRTTNLRVFEISDACGFSNAKYFSYVFKQEVGEKPLDYQKKRS